MPFWRRGRGGDDDGSVPGARLWRWMVRGRAGPRHTLFRGFDLLAPRSGGIALAQVKFQEKKGSLRPGIITSSWRMVITENKVGTGLYRYCRTKQLADKSANMHAVLRDGNPQPWLSGHGGQGFREARWIYVKSRGSNTTRTGRRATATNGIHWTGQVSRSTTGPDLSIGAGASQRDRERVGAIYSK
jgi:hypothetical protein